MSRRVLVFGSTGAGKTSICNELTGDQHPVSSDAIGCTFETTHYRPVFIGENLYELIDTVGLNEGTAGTTPSKTAMANLINLIRTNKEGFNLLIMVNRTNWTN